jgi:hypothetical protein
MLGQPVHGPGRRAQQRQERSGSERTGGAAPDGAWADEHSINREVLASHGIQQFPCETPDPNIF